VSSTHYPAAPVMKNKYLFLLGFCCFLSVHLLYAQEHSDFQFGKLTPADFNLTADKFDSSASAIYLADIETVNLEKNEVGDYDIIVKRFSRVKIVNKDGFSAGGFTLYLNVYVPYTHIFLKLPKPGLTMLKASTFNLENGIMNEEKLDPESVFSEKEGKDLMIVKFALPALKEGSVFDIEYATRSSFNFQDINNFQVIRDFNWNFQNVYPCLWSEYNLTIPNANNYFIKYQGDSSFYINRIDTIEHASDDPPYQRRTYFSHFRWVKTNEPPISSEPFIRSWKNYVDRVSLLHKWLWIVLEPYAYRSHTSDSWEGFSNMFFTLNGMKDFPDNENNWMRKEANQITATLQTKNEIAVAIYKYIRDHFSCVRNSFFVSQPMKETFLHKTGNVADINLLLTAMLCHFGIKSDPAVLSTVDNGYGNLSYPLPEDYNYVICVANIDGKEVLLDASQSLNPYGKLPPYCYNGGAVTLNTRQSKLIELNPDSLYESNRTNVIITSDEKGILSGGLTINYGVQKSFEIRKEVKNTSLKTYFNTILIKPQIRDLSNGAADELDNPDKPLTIHCDLNFRDTISSDIFYLNPVVFSFFKNNFFSAVKRRYMVEMPYIMDNIYSVSMDIPKGYMVEEMPQSSRILLNSTEGFFDYVIGKNANNIQLQMRMKLNKAFYTKDEYASLREFFNNVLKKENDLIVFRKVK
jgi:hypothetical protein